MKPAVLLIRLIAMHAHIWKTKAAAYAGSNQRQMPSRWISMDEVKKHNHAEDGWLVVNGVVYNTTPYLRFHPGGVEILKKALGRDATKLFNKYHPWVNVSALMDSCVVGLLERAKVEPVSKRDGATEESPS